MDGTPIEPSRSHAPLHKSGRNEERIGFGLEAEYDSYHDKNDAEGGGGDEGEYGEEYYEAQEDQEDDDHEEGIFTEESIVPVMSNEFYSDVDHFLNRPPPKFKGIMNQNKSKAREKLEETILKSSSLPVIIPVTKPKKIESKINTGRGKQQQGPGERRNERKLDINLLQQAFEYTARLEREASSLKEQEHEETTTFYSSFSKGKKSSSAPQISHSTGRRRDGHDHGSGGHSGYMVSREHDGGEDDGDEDDENGDEEEEEEDDRKQMKSKPPYHSSQRTSGGARGGGGRGSGRGGGRGNSGINKSSKGKKGTTSGGMVKRLRSQTFTHQTNETAIPSSFDTSMSHSDGGSHRQALDFNALVANFEQGLTLKQLKQELEDSRASMAKSKRAVDEISKEMSTKMRF